MGYVDFIFRMVGGGNCVPLIVAHDGRGKSVELYRGGAFSNQADAVLSLERVWGQSQTGRIQEYKRAGFEAAAKV